MNPTMIPAMKLMKIHATVLMLIVPFLAFLLSTMRYGHRCEYVELETFNGSWRRCV